MSAPFRNDHPPTITIDLPHVSFRSTLLIPCRGEMFDAKQKDGPLRRFPICMMNDFAEMHSKRVEPYIFHWNMHIEPEHVEHVRKNMGVEQPRLDRLAEPYLSKPAIGQVFDFHPEINKIAMELIDGNHRLVKLHELGRTHIDVYCFLPELWMQFCAPFKAENIFTGDSGMLDYERKRDGRNQRNDA